MDTLDNTLKTYSKDDMHQAVLLGSIQELNLDDDEAFTKLLEQADCFSESVLRAFVSLLKQKPERMREAVDVFTVPGFPLREKFFDECANSFRYQNTPWQNHHACVEILFECLSRAPRETWVEQESFLLSALENGLDMKKIPSKVWGEFERYSLAESLIEGRFPEFFDFSDCIENDAFLNLAEAAQDVLLKNIPEKFAYSKKRSEQFLRFTERFWEFAEKANAGSISRLQMVDALNSNIDVYCKKKVNRLINTLNEKDFLRGLHNISSGVNRFDDEAVAREVFDLLAGKVSLESLENCGMPYEYTSPKIKKIWQEHMTSRKALQQQALFTEDFGGNTHQKQKSSRL